VREKRLVGEAKSTAVCARVEYWVFRREKLMVKGWRGWKTFLDVQERVKEAFGLKIHQEFVV